MSLTNFYCVLFSVYFIFLEKIVTRVCKSFKKTDYEFFFLVRLFFMFANMAFVFNSLLKISSFKL